MPANRFGSLVQVQVVLISAKTKNVSDRYTHTHTHKLKLDSLPTSAVCCLCFFRAHIIFLSLPATWRKDCDWTDLIYRQLTLTSIFFSTWSHLLSKTKKKPKTKTMRQACKTCSFCTFAAWFTWGLWLDFVSFIQRYCLLPLSVPSSSEKRYYQFFILYVFLRFLDTLWCALKHFFYLRPKHTYTHNFMYKFLSLPWLLANKIENWTSKWKYYEKIHTGDSIFV